MPKYKVTFGRYHAKGRLSSERTFQSKKAAKAYIKRTKHLFVKPRITKVQKY